MPVRIFLFATLLLLSACAGKSYMYDPPSTYGGKACAEQCRISLDRCKNREQRLQESCLENWEISRKSAEMCNAGMGELPVDCMPVHNCPLPDEEMCLTHYNSCWQDCGGKVSTEDKGMK